MQQRSQRYVRRQRGWLGQTPASIEAGTVADGEPVADEATLRGRRRSRPHFDERMAATKALVGYTQADASRVAPTGPLLVPHISAIATEVYRGLLAHPETASQFCDASGVIDRNQVIARQAAFEEWLLSAVGDPLDAQTAEYLATVGHAHVRQDQPGGRIKARYLLTTVARAQTLFVAILADTVSDSAELGTCVPGASS